MMKRPLYRLINAIANTLLILALCLCGMIFLPRAAGIQTYVILSSSMEPAMPTGSLIYVRPYAHRTQLHPQDVIAFRSGESMVTHRVVQTNWREDSVITKGDANDTADAAPVPYQDIAGKVTRFIPYIGYVLMAVQTRDGQLVLCLVAAAIMALLYIASIGASPRMQAPEKPRTHTK